MIDNTETEKFNILVVNLDGLRRDKVHLIKSLNELIEKSFFFNNIDTVSPYTFASIHSIMTGTYPSKHGVDAYYNILKFKKNEISTIAEILKEKNFYTACDVNSEAILSKKGFDEYNVYDEQKIDFTKRHCDMIERISNKHFFLFLQNTETHNNYVRNIIENDEDEENYFNSINENNEEYESHLVNTENYVKKILHTLKRLDISNKTILIFLSDHGTSLGEKIGERFYGVFLYEYTMNVFTILHIPGYGRKLVEKHCSTIDIFPTITDLANSNFSTIDEKEGISLFSIMDDVNYKKRETFGETGGLYGPWPSPEKHNVFCLKNNKKKIIYNDTPETWEFYDLDKDSEEIKNEFDENTDEIIKMKSKLIDYLIKNNIKTKIS